MGGLPKRSPVRRLDCEVGPNLKQLDLTTQAKQGWHEQLQNLDSTCISPAGCHNNAHQTWSCLGTFVHCSTRRQEETKKRDPHANQHEGLEVDAKNRTAHLLISPVRIGFLGPFTYSTPAHMASSASILTKSF